MDDDNREYESFIAIIAEILYEVMTKQKEEQ